MRKSGMRAYLGKPELKAERISIMKAHQKADELVRGAIEGKLLDGTFRGCAVVCTVGKYQHKAYETELGIPIQLARIEDGLFESLPVEEAMKWPLQFLEAIPVGADLQIAYWRFMEWLLIDKCNGVIQYAQTNKAREVIQHVGDLYSQLLAGDTVSKQEWYAACDAADAAAYAADAAAWAAGAANAAAACAAWAADAAAARAAGAAGAAGAWAADAAAARAWAAEKLKARTHQKKMLLKFLREAKEQS